MHIYILKKKICRLCEDEEYYHHELIGLEVRNEDGVCIGHFN